MTHDNYMISFRNVNYSYSNSHKIILEGASFDVAKGEFAVIKGASGSGKSTILHLLSCEARAGSGEIHSGPFELSVIKRKHIPAYRRTIGCIYQDFKLLEEKTVAENVAFTLEVQRKYKSDAITKKVDEVLERIGITNERDQFPRELSEGSKQRAAIGRALVGEPMLLIADGAASQLDDETAAGIFSLLASENIRGMTILLTTATERFFPVFPKLAKYFELRDGKVDEFLPVS
jgi:cell division transport system ATP-binding protein